MNIDRDSEKIINDICEEKLALIGKLTETVSHELRNPLGTIKNSLFLIGEKFNPKDSATREDIKRAERSVDRCNKIIEELYDYSSKQKLILENINVDKTIKKTIAKLPNPQKNKIVSNLNIKKEILLDERLLTRSLQIIFQNSFDSFSCLNCNHKKPKIVISSKIIYDSIEIQIVDNGSGIPTEIQDKIFLPLFSTKCFGIGLGLPIIKNFMDKLSGNIDIKSIPDKKTDVKLTIPVI